MGFFINKVKIWTKFKIGAFPDTIDSEEMIAKKKCNNRITLLNNKKITQENFLSDYQLDMNKPVTYSQF
nr:hypothetical protein [uncultured Chryseobacterium sp.]